MLKTDQVRMKELLAQTIRLLCKNGLNFISELSVEALIGITVDQTDVFLINIKETVQTEALLLTNLDSVETGGQEARPNLNSSIGSESVVNEESNAEQQSVRLCHSANRSDILFDSSSESSEAAKKLRLIKSESASVAISDIQTEQFISDKESDKIMRAPAGPYSAVKTIQKIRKPFFKTRSRKRSLSRQLLYNFESSDNYQLTPVINLNSHHATELSKYSRNIVENSVGTRETMSERCINGTGDQLDSKTNTSNDKRFQVKSEVLSDYTDSSYADNTVYLEDPVSPFGADSNVLPYTDWNLGHSGPGVMRSGSHQSASWNMNDADTEDAFKETDLVELLPNSNVFIPSACFYLAEREEKGSRLVRHLAYGLFSSSQLARSSCLGQSRTSTHGCLQQNKIDAILAYVQQHSPAMTESSVIRTINNLCCEARRKDLRQQNNYVFKLTDDSFN